MKKAKNDSKNIFEGEEAIKDFLNPSSLGMIPIVELPSSLNPFKEDKVRIFIKLMQFVPLYNIKSLPAWSMLSGVPKEDFKNINHLVEYSSGNTVLSLTIMTRHFGIPHMHAIITPDVPEHKKRLLKLVGTEIFISHGPSCPDVNASVGGVYEAKMMGKKKGWHNLNQYINPEIPKASAEYIGKELWNQLDGKMTIFASTIGTAGTIYGASSYLKKKNENIFIAGATIKKGSSIPGPRGEEHINKLAFPWRKMVDQVIPVDTVSAYKSSLDLIRLGLFVGPSTGMLFAMVLQMIKNMKKDNTLDKHRNKNGEVVVAFISGDTMYPYIDEYFENLPKRYFRKEKHLKNR
jgi:cysteine synthase